MKNRAHVRVLSVLTIFLLLMGTVVANVSFADSTSLILDNTTDPTEKTEYRIGEPISPRAFFQLSDASNQCLRLHLEIDKEAVKQGYALIADGGGTWLDLANAEKVINYTSADKPEDRYQMEYEFNGLKAGSQVAVPFPFKTADSTPPGTKINTIAKLYTCGGVLLNSAEKAYTVGEQLIARPTARVYVNDYMEHADNTVRWASSTDIEFNKKDNLIPANEKCVYVLRYGYSRWEPTGLVGAIQKPVLRLVAHIPPGAKLLPEAENPGWTYDLANNIAYFTKKNGDVDYSYGQIPLRFSCSGISLPDSKSFTVDLEIAKPDTAPAGPWTKVTDDERTFNFKNIPHDFGVIKESFIDLEKEKGRTTEVEYYDHNNYRIKRTDASGKTTYKVVPINPDTDIYGEDNVNRWRITAYNNGTESINVADFDDIAGNKKAFVVSLRIIFEKSSSSLIERMKANDRYYYYYENHDHVLRKIPDSGEITFPISTSPTWVAFGAYYAGQSVEMKPGEKIVYEVVTRRNEASLAEADNDIIRYGNLQFYNRGQMYWLNPDNSNASEKIDTISSYLVRTSHTSVNVSAGNDKILSYTQCEKTLSAGEKPSWVNCGRYSAYYMSVFGKKDFLNDELPAGKLVSVTLLPRGVEYVRELNTFEGAYRADGAARGAVTTKIIPNYKGTGQQAIVREWDMDYLKQIYDGNRSTLDAPIELEAKSFTKAGNNEIKTYWYPKDTSTIKIYDASFSTRLLDDPKNQWVDLLPQSKGYEADTLDVDPKLPNIYQTTTIYNFNPPTVGSIYKLVSSNSDPNVGIANKGYGTYSEPTVNSGEIYYQIGIVGGPTPLSTFDVIDVLPTHPTCDYNIADLQGRFGKRTWINPGAKGQAGQTNECSAFATPLKSNPELLAENASTLSLFNVKYSTEAAPSPVSATNNLATKNWNWKTASQITDWSKVTAYMLSLKPGKSLAKNQELYFYTRNFAQADGTTFDESLSVNQAALSTIDPVAYKRTIDDWVRSNDARSVIRVYRIYGNVFNDLSRDTHKDPEDSNLQGYPVTIKDKSGKVIGTTTSDANGNWSYLLADGGDYTVEVGRKDPASEYYSYDRSGNPPASSENNIYSTIDREGKRTVSLTVDNREARVDAGIYRYQVEVNTTVTRWNKPIYQWTIDNKVLDDNDPSKTYVASDTRETRRAPSDNSAMDLPLNYQLTVSAQKVGTGFSQLKGSAYVVNQTASPITTKDQDGMVFSLSPAARDAFDCKFDNNSPVNNITVPGQTPGAPYSGSVTVFFTCTLKPGKTLPAEKDVTINVLPQWKSGVYAQNLKPATGYGINLDEPSTVKIKDPVTIGTAAVGNLEKVNFKYTYQGMPKSGTLEDIVLNGADVAGFNGGKVVLTAEIPKNTFPGQTWPTVTEKTKTVHTDAYLIDNGTGVAGSGTGAAITKLSRASVITNVVAATTPIYVHKVGELNAARTSRKDLPGAEFKLYNATATGGLGTLVNGAVKPMNANETMPGTAFLFKVSDLEIGKKYFLVESKAPSGYNLIPQPIAFTVREDGTVDISINEQNSIYLSVKDYTGAGVDANSPLPPKELVVYDSPVALLPFSGGNGIYLWGLVGGLAVFLSVRALNRASSRFAA